jgi:hypothetical protein
MTFRHDINGLRAIAVVAVVLFHFQVPGFSAGFLGVDVFFVISGFLMAGILLRRLDNNPSGGGGKLPVGLLPRSREANPAGIVGLGVGIAGHRLVVIAKRRLSSVGNSFGFCGRFSVEYPFLARSRLFRYCLS